MEFCRLFCIKIVSCEALGQYSSLLDYCLDQNLTKLDKISEINKGFYSI